MAISRAPADRCVVLALAMVTAMAAPAAFATTFTVTTTADSGAGSLRQAIAAANAQQVTDGTLCAPHTIVFAIPGNAPHTIQPLSALPPLRIAITLDAFTQPGSSPNSQLLGANAIVGIELDGSLAGASNGIVVEPAVSGVICGGNGSIIRGFALNRFAGSAIVTGVDSCAVGQSCSSLNVRIVGNYIGTDVTGLLARPNGATLARPAIRIGPSSVGIIIGDQIAAAGGPGTPTAANRNVISGNASDAIAIAPSPPGSQAQANQVRNNFIGLNAPGTGALPNGGSGVTSGSNATGTQIHENLIAGNVGAGVAIIGNPIAITGNPLVTNLIGNGIGIGVGGVAFGNGGDGVYVSASQGVSLVRAALFGGFGLPSIANNAGAGVYVEPDSVVDIIALPIADNGGLGIDLAPTGVNSNDDQDPDGGANERLNSPVIAAASFDPSTGLGTIQGTINTVPNSTVEILFHSSTNCDPSGFGEGQTVVGGSSPLLASVTTNAAGDGSFSVQTNSLQVGRQITALTRSFTRVPGLAALQVSEFSACRAVVSSGPFIFADGFEPPGP